MSEDVWKYLATKKRSVRDLIQFVKTRTDCVSNYTLLLGAGASVTSDVRSAGMLIEEWRKEIYTRLAGTPSTSYSIDDARAYLSRNHSQWYSQQREYSSLFEKQFDLPRQRRMFVENEVSGKMPSLGYAYLTRLVQENFVNTIFTTNFDDLINEAFHQFSDIRPIVCAHDSSIASVTVTSKRPKVIKLHGDYLFDDIKSTVRETESLEENTKKKFVEFSKDHGLVVVGYGGHDRSVMDVLQHLLKQEDYFKHGIYWCLRDDQTPSEELVKLLWKERVYWVPVEGFDELMAQLHEECIGSQLPIDTALVSDKPREIVRKLCENPKLIKSSSDLLQRDLARLRQELSREALVESLRDVTRMERQDDEEPNSLRDSEVIKLMSITQLMEDRDYLKALEKIKIELAQSPSLDFKEELLIKRLAIESQSGDLSAALRTCDALFDLDPQNPYYLLSRVGIERSSASKLSSISRAIVLDPYYPSAFRMRAEFYEDQIENDPICDIQRTVELVSQDYEKAIELNPTIGNSAWEKYAQFLLGEFLSKQEANKRLETLLARLRILDPYSPLYLRVVTECVKKGNSVVTEGKGEVISNIRTAIATQPRARKRQLELLLLRSMKKLGLTDELLSEITSYDGDERWNQNTSFVRLRAEIYAELEGKIHDAIRKIEAYKKHTKDATLMMMMLQYLCFLKKIGEAQRLLDSCGFVIGPDRRAKIQRDIYESAGEYEKSLASIRKEKESATFSGEHVVNEVHVLLKLGKSKEAETAARKVLELAHFSKPYDALIVNFELAVQRQGRKIDKVRLQKVADRNASDSLICVAALFMLDEKERAAQLLSKAIEKDKTRAQWVSEWALFDTPGGKAWLTETLSARKLIPDISPSEVKKAAS